MLLGGDQWLAGTWYTKSSYPLAGEPLLDVNGVTITVGATVKFVGIVTAINNDPHYGTIQVTALHPNGQAIVFDPGQGLPRSINFPIPNPQNKDTIRGFEPLQLVVGS